jgi:hypothetical protein
MEKIYICKKNAGKKVIYHVTSGRVMYFFRKMRPQNPQIAVSSLARVENQ